MTIKTQLLSTGALNKRIAAVCSSFEKSGKLLHAVMCECLFRAREHGDVTGCERLYKGLPPAAWREGVKAWFAAMGPITARGDNWGLKKGWTKEQFKMEEAETTDINAKFGEPRPPRMFSVAVWLGQMSNIGKRIDNALTEEKFQGDVEASKAFFKDVVDFAKVRAAKLSAQQSGQLESDADTILKTDKAPASIVTDEQVKAAQKAGIKVSRRKKQPRSPEQVAREQAAA